MTPGEETDEAFGGKPAVPQRGMGGLLHSGARAFATVLQRRLSEHDIPISFWFHLTHLYSEDGLTQVELAERLGITKASSTDVLNGLEKRGLLKRIPRSDDRRKIALHLTEEGRSMTEMLAGYAVEVNRIARRGLTDRQVSDFIFVLQTMMGNLRQT